MIRKKRSRAASRNCSPKQELCCRLGSLTRRDQCWVEPRRGLMSRKRNVLVAVVVSFAIMTPSSAMGKGSGPIKLMNPRGHVLAVRGDAADRWWRYFKRAKCSSCDSARHAAVLLHRVESARLRRGGAPTYLFKPRFLGVSWPGAWVLYASTKRTPAYVVVRGGVADNGKQWDSWTPVTKRVERVLLRRSGVRTTTSSEVHAPASEPRRPLLPLVCGVAALSI